MLNFIFKLIFGLKGGDIMVEVFATLIVYGTRVFSDVPVSLQPSVKALLLTMGLDENGDPIVVE